MAKFRKVHTTFWDDGFVEKLSVEDRYFYLFLLTNPLATECGIYQVSIKKMSFYTGYNQDAIIPILRRFVEQGKIQWDADIPEIYIVNRLKYIDNFGKPTLDCLKMELKNVKSKSFLSHFLQRLPKTVFDYVDPESKNEVIDNQFFTKNNTGRQRGVNGASTPRGEEREREREREKEREAGAENFEKEIFDEVRRQTPTGNWHWQKAFSKKIAQSYNPNDVKNLSRIVETWIEKETTRVR